MDAKAAAAFPLFLPTPLPDDIGLEKTHDIMSAKVVCKSLAFESKCSLIAKLPSNQAKHEKIDQYHVDYLPSKPGRRGLLPGLVGW